MFSRLLECKSSKELLLKAGTVILVCVIGIVAINVLFQDKDGRRQIMSEEGTEEVLCSILEDMEGAGDVDVMLEYDEEKKVSGVIVSAEGARDIVIRDQLTKAVSALFNISGGNVAVYEKKAGGESK